MCGPYVSHMPSVRRTEDVVCTFEERFIQFIYQTLITTSLRVVSLIWVCVLTLVRTDTKVPVLILAFKEWLFVWEISSILLFNSVHNLHESIWVSSPT